MNLWHLFPKSLLHIPGILQLPYLAIFLYLFLFYALFRYPTERKLLSIFLLLSLAAIGIMANNLHPGFGKVIPPLALIVIILLPLSILIFKLSKKSYTNLHVWIIATLAGWSHSMGWGVWLFALAGS